MWGRLFCHHPLQIPKYRYHFKYESNLADALNQQLEQKINET